MSYQPEPEKSADPNAQPPQYQPPAGQLLQYPAGQYPPAGQYSPPGQYPPPGQYYPLQPQPGAAHWGPPPAQYPQAQQQQSSNVVVVGAQPTAAPTVVVTQRPHAPDYLILTVVGFILCFFFGGVVGMLLLLPALICSIMAQNASNSGDYDTAKRLGQFSLGWNIGVYILYALMTIGWIIAIAVWIGTIFL